MAELLLYMGEERGDNGFFYRKGDPISAHADGFSYGSKECLNTFLVVRLIDVTQEEAQQFIGSDNSDIISRWNFPVYELLTEDEIGQIGQTNWSVPEFYSSVMVDRLA